MTGYRGARCAAVRAAPERGAPAAGSWVPGRRLGFLRLTDLSLSERSEPHSFPVRWPFACPSRSRSGPGPESGMQKRSVAMVTGQQHCLALGVLVPNEINASRKDVDGLALGLGHWLGGASARTTQG